MGNSTQPDLSVDGSMKVWSNARFAREKILMDMPNYGYVDKNWLRERRKRRDIIEPVQSYSEENEAPQDFVTGSLIAVKLSSDGDSANPVH